MKIIRKRILEELTDNFGNVIESGDKIICSVDEEVIEKGRPLIFNTLNDYKKWIIKKYNINKKIWFIIDGITFDKPVYFTGLNDCNLYISNCEFKSNADFDIEGSIYFDNVILNSCFISSNSLNIKNTNIRDLDSNNTTNIALCGKRSVKVENSLIGLNKENTNVSIITVFLSLKNSNINANKLKLDAFYYDISGTKIDYNEKIVNNKEIKNQTLSLK